MLIIRITFLAWVHSDQFAVYFSESDDQDRDEIESGPSEDWDEDESSEDEPSAFEPNPAGW